MAAEILELEVKSNIKSATTQTKDWGKSLEQVNEEIQLQNKWIVEQEKELIKLKAKQDAIPKGAWVKGMDTLNDKIQKTTEELKLEKNALKGLKDEQKEAADKVKEFNKAQKDQDKVIKDGIGNFQVMGVSLNGIKKSITNAIPLIKLMFSSIRTGLISTGIGAFVVAFGSIVTFVTSTKEGMDKLNVVLAKAGAAFNVIKDRVSDFGKTLTNVFSQSLFETLRQFKNIFTGVGDEMKKETKLAGELEVATQKLRDLEKEFTVTKAERNKEIAKARLLSEDEETSLKNRRVALANAIKLEQENMKAEKDHQAERVRILTEITKMSKSSAQDEQNLADAQAKLIDLETKSLKAQKRLKRELNSIDREIAAEEQKRIDDKKIADALALEKKKEEAAVLLALQQENTLGLITDLKERALAELKIQEDKEMASAELMANSEEVKAEIAKKFARKRGEVEQKFAKNQVKWSEMSSKQQLDIASTTAGNMVAILGEETAAGKAMAVVQATIDTYKGATAAYASMAGIPVVGPGLGVIAAGAAVAAGLKNVQAILSTGDGGGSAGGAAPSTPSVTTAPPAPQMMSGAFELTGGTEPQPIQAYVVSDEITDSQNGLEIIRRRATI